MWFGWCLLYSVVVISSFLFAFTAEVFISFLYPSNMPCFKFLVLLTFKGATMWYGRVTYATNSFSINYIFFFRTSTSILLYSNISYIGWLFVLNLLFICWSRKIFLFVRHTTVLQESPINIKCSTCVNLRLFADVLHYIVL